jgi:hypothetical protein
VLGRIISTLWSRVIVPLILAVEWLAFRLGKLTCGEPVVYGSLLPSDHETVPTAPN